MLLVSPVWDTAFQHVSAAAVSMDVLERHPQVGTAAAIVKAQGLTRKLLVAP